MRTSLFYLVLFFLPATVGSLFAVAPEGIVVHGARNACKGSQVVYEIYNPQQGYSYSWTATGGSVISSTNHTATVLWLGTPLGSLDVDAHFEGQVVDSTSITVQIGEEPEPVILPQSTVGCARMPIPATDPPPDRKEDDSDCLLQCAGSTVEFVVEGRYGSTFVWSVTGGSFPDGDEEGTSVYVEWGAAGFGQITVTETTAGGCVEIKTKCVEIIEKPVAAFEIVPKQVNSTGKTCIDRELNFIDRSTAGEGTPIVSWHWDFGDGTTSTDPDPSHTYTSTGVYEVRLVVKNECHCEDEFMFTIKVDDADPLEIECPAVACENQQVFYSVVDPSCEGYEWEVIGGEITSHGADGTVGVTWTEVGDEHEQVPFGYLSAIPCDNSCPTSIKIPIVNSNGVIEGPEQICEDEETFYRLPRWPGTEFNWSAVGDVDMWVTDQPNEVVLIPHDNATGLVVLRCTYNNPLAGCSGKALLEINIAPPAEMSGPVESCVGQSEAYRLSDSHSGNWKLMAQDGTFSTGNGNQFNPSFAAAGTYVLTVRGSSFCPPDPMTIEVLPQPVSPDTIEGPDEVCAGIPYTFTTGNSIPGTTLNWSVTGGDFSNGNSIISGEKAVVTFNQTPFKLEVWREYQSGMTCQSPVLEKLVSHKQVNLSTEGDDSVCVNSTQFYEASYTEGELYEWTIEPETMGSVVSGDGTSAVEVLWNNSATQDTARLKLKMRVCGDEHIFNKFIVIYPVPTIDLTGDATVCRGDVANFTITSTPAISFSEVHWDFGDGSTAVTTSLSTTHVYEAFSGTNINYMVTAEVVGPNSCPEPSTASTSITVEPSPVAVITPAGNQSFCNGQSFSETLTANAQSGPGTYSYEWFEVGSGTSVATGLTHVVDQNNLGTYYCVVTDTTTNCSEESNHVTFSTHSCSGGSNGGSGGTTSCRYTNSSDIDLTYLVTSCGDVEVTASVSNFSGTNPSWSGSHTVGSTSNPYTATYDYEHAGPHTVSFSIDDPSGTETCEHSKSIVVMVPYIAKLKYDVTCSSTGNGYDVTLRDHSEYYPDYPLTNYEFLIDGNPVSSGSSPTYTALNLTNGSYTVELRVDDGVNLPCTVTEVIDLPDLPNADFEFDFDGACKGFPISFTNLSTPATGLTYEWSFGDQTGVRVENPSRAFANPGLYSVTLTVENEWGCTDSVTKPLTVSPNNLAGGVLPDHTIACDGGSLLLSYDPDPSSATPDTYFWQPDSFAIVSSTNSTSVYEAGSYFLTVVDQYMCTRSTDNIEVEFVPVPQAVITGTSAVCAGEDIKLFGDAGSGDYSYDWSLVSGGSFTSTDSNITLGTGTGGLGAGLYTFQLDVGISSPISCSRTATFDVVVHPAPPAIEIEYALSQCEPYQLTLTASPNTGDDDEAYQWSDGQVGTEIIVERGGEYTVTYTDRNGCSSSASIFVPKTPQDYLWIYPLGCYSLCDDQLTSGVFDIPDPVIEFNQWSVNPGPSSSGEPDVELQVTGTSGQYSYTLAFGECSATSQYTDLEIKDCECEIEVRSEPMDMIYDHEGCRNVIDMSIANPYSVPISVSLSSDKGIFIPSTVTVPPGGAIFTLEFIANPGVAGGSQAQLIATADIPPEMADEDFRRCYYEDEITLYSELCDYTGRKSAEADAEVEDESGLAQRRLFQLAPNPANTEVRVMYELSNTQTGGKLAIHDLRGALVDEYELAEGKGTQLITTAQWKPSVYFIILHTNDGEREVQRLVIQR